MVEIQKFNNTTLSRIENQSKLQELRPYLGMSKIGHACSRYLWYSFRWAFRKEITSRQRRLFKRGHREEQAIIDELESVGVICYGFQDEVEMAFGHSKGHSDGKAINVVEAPKTPHLLEFKTMNDKQFKKMRKEGVKKSKPVYYAQMQIYMWKMGLTRALFCAVNKNDDSFYFERVRLDIEFANELQEKAQYIITSMSPPKKLSTSSTWYECKWCDALEVCHYGQTLHETCRSCRHCDIHPKGIWKCSRAGMNITTSQQRLGCAYYEPI